MTLETFCKIAADEANKKKKKQSDPLKLTRRLGLGGAGLGAVIGGLMGSMVPGMGLRLALKGATSLGSAGVLAGVFGDSLRSSDTL